MSKPKLQALEAENKRLKRIMKRMYHDRSCHSPNKSPKGGLPKGYLPFYISSLLEANQPFANRISKTLEAIGDFIDASRIYIFENNTEDTTLFSNTYEWCNEGVQPEIDNLKNLPHDQFAEWSRMLIEDGYIVASNIIEQLPSAIHEPLSHQNIKAILVYPLWVKNKLFGFIGIDECSFNREWMPHETDVLQMIARLIANSYEKETDQAQLKKHIQIQQLILDISNTLNSTDKFEHQLNKAFNQLVAYFNTEHSFLYENINANKQCRSKFENAPDDDSSISTSTDTILTYKTDLNGWLEAFEKEGIYNSGQHIDPNSSTKQELCSTIAVPIRSKDHFWGFIGFKKCKPNYIWKTSHKKALRTIADLFGNTYQRKLSNDQLRHSHAEILDINKQLAGKEQFLNNILSAAPVGVLLIRNRKIEYINNATMAQSGYTRDELIGQALTDLYFKGKEDLSVIKNFYQEIEQYGISSMESHMKSKNGEKIILRVLGTPAPHSAGKDSFLLIGEDITHIKKTESHLRESEERNRKLIEATIDGIFIVKHDMRVAFANDSACKMLAYSEEEILNLTVEDIFPSEDYIQRFEEATKKIKSGHDYKGDTQLYDSNKQLIHAEVYGTTLKLEGEPHYYFSVHNITKRKNNEVSLINSERKFRALTENSPDHILRIDKHGVLSFCNSSFLKGFDLRESDCIGQKITNIEALPKELISGLDQTIRNVMTSARATHIDLEFKHKEKELAFDWTITPETNNALQLSSILIIGRNFTQKKLAEQELVVAKEKAISADKLKSAFLANMSHEIRTPLNAIVGFTNLLKEEGLTELEKTDYIDIINKSSENLIELINDIVDLAKIESGELNLITETCDATQLLNEMHVLFKKRMAIDKKEHINFSLKIPNNTSLIINCDPRRLRQIFINLLGNAFKFTHTGLIEFGYTIEEKQIRFFVRDTGIGIHPDKQSIVFEAFRQADESTSKNYGGTGLGLPICKRLVSAHDGDIGLRSKPQNGSEFYFTIPFSSSDKAKLNAKEAQVNAALPTNYNWSNKMLLLIDATSHSQLQMKKAIKHTNITLMSARTLRSARELLLKRSDISLVLMDVEMPDLALNTFMSDIRQLGIYIPFIGQTSRTISPEEKNEYLKMGFTQILVKPLETAELMLAFNHSLQGAESKKSFVDY